MPDPAVTGQSGAMGGATGVIDPATTATPDSGWFETLPDGLKGEKSLEAFKGKPISAVVESFVSAQKSFGSRVPIPQASDTPEEKATKTAQFRAAMGVPASPDKYVVKQPAAEELGITWDPKLQTRILDFAHKQGLTNDQTQAAIDLAADVLKGDQPDYAADRDACIKMLTDGDETTPGWGSTTPRFLAVAKRTVDTMFPKGVMDRLNLSGLANDPDFIRGLYRIGKELGESGVIFPEHEMGGPGNESTSAQTELDKILADAKGPYYDSKHVDHDRLVEKALSLRRFLASA